MQDDSRAEAAQYYDANPTIPDDLAFYTARLPSPDAFEGVIRAHGFRIVQRWGGYAGERYGEGPELIVQFCG